MANVRYSWKRFFLKRGDEPPYLIEDAYLSDPEDGIFNKQVASLDRFHATQCMVILGEPGIGKSTALEDEEVRLKQQEDHDFLPPLLLRMEEFSTPDELRKAFQYSDWEEWKKGNKTLPLLLDSLDEVRIHVETACLIIANILRSVDISRLRIRISCRSRDWPSHFENDLKKLWNSQSKQVVIVHTLPLRMKDVENAAKDFGVNSESFMTEIGEKDLHPFAAKPITLCSLLKDYKLNESLPKSKWDIYERLCNILCDEPNPRYKEIPKLKATSTLDTDTRMEVASKIAATMILCDRHYVSKCPQELSISYEDLVCGKKEHGYLLENEIEEVMRTSLFHPYGNMRYRFSHQCFMEFLCARYLSKLPFKQLRSICSIDILGSTRIMPQLREVAAWLSHINRDFRKWLIKCDPITIIPSELSNLSDTNKYQLVENLMFELDRLEYFDSGLVWGNEKKLMHPQLSQQLKPYITDIAKTSHTRMAAIDIAKHCKCIELSEILLDLICNPNEIEIVRSHACYAMESIGTSNHKSQLQGVLLVPENPVSDRLKWNLLRVLWPNHLTIEELLGMITPPQDTHVAGGYDTFLSNLGEEISPNDIPKTLEHFVDQDKSLKQSGYWFERLGDSLLSQGIKNLNISGMKPSLARFLVWRHLNDHEIIGHDASKELKQYHKDNPESRRALVEEILKIPIPDESNNYHISDCVRFCIERDDFFWLLSIIDNYPTERQILILRILVPFLYPNEHYSPDSPYLDAFLCKLRSCGKDVQDDFAWTNGIDLGSEHAKRERRRLRERRARETREKRKKQSRPMAEDVLNENLPKARQGSLNSWFLVCAAVCTDSERVDKYGFRTKHFFSEADGWENLGDPTKIEINQAAYEFLNANIPQDHSWLSSSSRDGKIWSGQIALSLMGSDPQLLSSLPKDTLKAWMPTVIGFWGNPDNNFQKMMKHAYETCPDEFIHYLDVKVEFENSNNSYAQVLHHLEFIMDQRLEEYFLGKLKSEDCKPQCFAHICNLLVPRNPTGFEEFIVSKIPCSPEDTKDQKNISKKAFQVTLRNWAQKHWELIKTHLTSSSQMCYEALCDMSFEFRRNESANLLPLEPQQMAELYVWLRGHKARELEKTESGDEEDFNYLTLDNYMVNTLVKSATNESMAALKYIYNNLEDKNKKYFKYHLNQAEEEYRRKSIVSHSPDEILRIYWLLKRRKFYQDLCILIGLVIMIDIILWISKLVTGITGFLLVDGIIALFWYYRISPQYRDRFINLKREIENFVRT